MLLFTRGHGYRTNHLRDVFGGDRSSSCREGNPLVAWSRRSHSRCRAEGLAYPQGSRGSLALRPRPFRACRGSRGTNARVVVVHGPGPWTVPEFCNRILTSPCWELTGLLLSIFDGTPGWNAASRKVMASCHELNWRRLEEAGLHLFSYTCLEGTPYPAWNMVMTGFIYRMKIWGGSNGHPTRWTGKLWSLGLRRSRICWRWVEGSGFQEVLRDVNKRYQAKPQGIRLVFWLRSPIGLLAILCIFHFYPLVSSVVKRTCFSSWMEGSSKDEVRRRRWAIKSMRLWYVINLALNLTRCILLLHDLRSWKHTTSPWDLVMRYYYCIQMSLRIDCKNQQGGWLMPLTISNTSDRTITFGQPFHLCSMHHCKNTQTQQKRSRSLHKRTITTYDHKVNLPPVLWLRSLPLDLRLGSSLGIWHKSLGQAIHHLWPYGSQGRVFVSEVL